MLQKAFEDHIELKNRTDKNKQHRKTKILFFKRIGRKYRLI